MHLVLANGRQQKELEKSSSKRWPLEWALKNG